MMEENHVVTNSVQTTPSHHCFLSIYPGEDNHFRFDGQNVDDIRSVVTDIKIARLWLRILLAVLSFNTSIFI